MKCNHLDNNDLYGWFYLGVEYTCSLFICNNCNILGRHTSAPSSRVYWQDQYPEQTRVKFGESIEIFGEHT